MKVRALRGVCIGPGRHLLPGECADLDAATAQYLASIAAVESVVDAASPGQGDTPTETPGKPGKKEK